VKRAVAVLAFVLAAPLLADEIQLRGGGKLTGEIVDRTEDSVTIDIGAGTMTVQRSTIVGIDEESTSALQEYRARAARIAADDIEGWRTLGRWAVQYGLSAQAHDAYSHVHAANPNDLDANRALGLVLYEGRWITEEESYKARGFVKFGGDWMTPEERDGIRREESARAEENRQHVAEQVRTSQAAIDEREAAEEAAEEARRAEQFSLPQLGDPVWWGYGYGPSYSGGSK
jgi:hypothetical protein